MPFGKNEAQWRASHCGCGLAGETGRHGSRTTKNVCLRKMRRFRAGYARIGSIMQYRKPFSLKANVNYRYGK
ncbi:hypothetical protein P3T16_001136 [Paraburkholderia sp. GAS42]